MTIATTTRYSQHRLANTLRKPFACLARLGRLARLGWLLGHGRLPGPRSAWRPPFDATDGGAGGAAAAWASRDWLVPAYLRRRRSGDRAGLARHPLNFSGTA